MSRNTIIGVVIVIVIIVIVVFVYTKKGSYTQPQMMHNENSVSQTQSKTTTTQVGNDKVTIQNFAFSPEKLTIKKGASVTFTNEDSVGHSATADDKSFDTGVLPKGQSKAITFDKPGTYSYRCSVHPNMKGTITVTE